MAEFDIQEFMTTVQAARELEPADFLAGFAEGNAKAHSFHRPGSPRDKIAYHLLASDTLEDLAQVAKRRFPEETTPGFCIGLMAGAITGMQRARAQGEHHE